MTHSNEINKEIENFKKLNFAANQLKFKEEFIKIATYYYQSMENIETYADKNNPATQEEIASVNQEVSNQLLDLLKDHQVYLPKEMASFVKENFILKFNIDPLSKFVKLEKRLIKPFMPNSICLKAMNHQQSSDVPGVLLGATNFLLDRLKDQSSSERQQVLKEFFPAIEQYFKNQEKNGKVIKDEIPQKEVQLRKQEIIKMPDLKWLENLDENFRLLVELNIQKFVSNTKVEGLSSDQKLQQQKSFLITLFDAIKNHGSSFTKEAAAQIENTLAQLKIPNTVINEVAQEKYSAFVANNNGLCGFMMKLASSSKDGLIAASKSTLFAKKSTASSPQPNFWQKILGVSGNNQ